MQVEVVFATRERQWLIQLSVPKGSSAIDAVRLSGLDNQYAQIMGNDTEPGLGVFGQLVTPDHLLAKGDRVELYRPLKADFKDVRRELAKEGKVMGRARTQIAE